MNLIKTFKQVIKHKIRINNILSSMITNKDKFNSIIMKIIRNIIKLKMNREFKIN